MQSMVFWPRRGGGLRYAMVAADLRSRRLPTENLQVRRCGAYWPIRSADRSVPQVDVSLASQRVAAYKAATVLQDQDRNTLGQLFAEALEPCIFRGV